MVFGVSGSNGARPICGSIKSKMVAGGHLGMMAPSDVTVASADGLLLFQDASCVYASMEWTPLETG